MHLTRILKLQTKNFRNLSEEIIEFAPHINCIFGQNGNGKTNILEAVYFLCRKKSFRKKTSFPQMLNFDGINQNIILNGIFSDIDETPHQLTCQMETDGSQWFLDGKSFRKRNALSCIFVNPFDSYQFFNSTTFKRELVDDLICDLSENYSLSLGRYEKYLRQRNKLLQLKSFDYENQVRALDKSIAPDIVVMTNEKEIFAREMNEYLPKIFGSLFLESAELSIKFEQSYLGLSEEQVYQTIQSKLERDKAASLTLSGIHKDNALLTYNGLDSAQYCSLGQQKMAFLSLFFAFIELFGYKFESYPLVLLDDVSGELDSERWGRLVGFLNDRRFQVLITTANEKFRESLENIKGANKFYVHQGTLVN